MESIYSGMVQGFQDQNAYKARLLERADREAALARQARLDEAGARQQEFQNASLMDYRKSLAEERGFRNADRQAATEQKRLELENQALAKRSYDIADALYGITDGGMSPDEVNQQWPDVMGEISDKWSLDGNNNLIVTKSDGTSVILTPEQVRARAEIHRQKGDRLLNPGAAISAVSRGRVSDQTASRKGLLTPDQLADNLVRAAKLDVDAEERKAELDRAKVTTGWFDWRETQAEKDAILKAQADYDAASGRAKTFRGIVDKATPPELKASNNNELDNEPRKPLLVNPGKGSLLPVRKPAQPTPITKEIAQDFLRKAGGDKNKARQLALEAGYTF
jgi:hypothetical protein